MTSICRIAFVDDHPTLLRGLAAVFAEEPDFDVVATGASAADMVSLVRERSPDVVIVDLSMPGDVFSAIADCIQIRPTLKIIVFSAYANVDFGMRAFDSGVSGYVVKGSAPEELFTAIATARKGELYVSKEFSSQMGLGLRNRRRESRQAGPIPLTPREQQLAIALTKGMSNREIAESLNLTEKTVKHYMTNLMVKLQVRTRLEAALVAQRRLPAEAVGLAPILNQKQREEE